MPLNVEMKGCFDTVHVFVYISSSFGTVPVHISYDLKLLNSPAVLTTIKSPESLPVPPFIPAEAHKAWN